MSIADQLTHLSDTKTAIREAIEEKGVTVPVSTPFRQYGEKIREIREGVADEQWVRPAGRPPLPFDEEEGPEDHTVWMLFGVQPTGSNDYAFRLGGSGGTWTAEWGDGDVNTQNLGVTAEHIFDYASLDVTPDEGGTKWVWMKFYSTPSRPFTSIFTNVRHSSRPSGSSSNIFMPSVYEIYIRHSTAVTWTWSSSVYTRLTALESLIWYGNCSLTSFTYFLYYSSRLRSLSIDTSNGTNFNSFLSGATLFNQPLSIDTSNGTNFSSFLSGAASFNQPLNIDTSKGTTFSSFLANTPLFNQPLNIDTSKATLFGAAFLSGVRPAFVGPITLDVGGLTGSGYLSLTTCIALRGLRLLNASQNLASVSVAGSNMGTEALAALISDLPDRTALEVGTITITDTPGAYLLTPEQRAIATNKNWTIVD